jgi:general secretion pathway protein K
MWTGLYASANLRDGIRLDFMARSGVNCALAVLSEDASSSSSDSLKEPWARSKELSINSVGLFEHGRFQVEISDLSGKIPINRLINENGEYNEARKMLLTRFLSLERFGLEPEAIGNLIDAIKDWIDPDDEVTRFGAENGYYQSLENPYACGNGPIDSLGQLRLVKGMTDALFFGSDDNGSGISKHLTVYGDGRININTADPLVLRALSDDIDTDMVQDMMAYRLDEKNDLTDPEWYRKIPGMGDVTIDPDLIKTSSDYFEIWSAGMAEAESMTRQTTAVVRRKGGSSIQIVAWKAE